MKVFALIYHYYQHKKLPEPYFRTVMTLIGFFIMFLALLFSIFPLPTFYFPFGISKNSLMNYIYGGVFVGILYLIISLVIKKKNLERYIFTEGEFKTCRNYILSIFFILLILLFGAIILQVRNRW